MTRWRLDNYSCVQRDHRPLQVIFLASPYEFFEIDFQTRTVVFYTPNNVEKDNMKKQLESVNASLK